MTTPEVEAIQTGRQVNRNRGQLSVESLALVCCTTGVSRVENQMANEYVELRERQERIHVLHQLQREINASSEAGEGFDWSDNPELQALVERARELGVPIPGEQGDYVFDEADQRALMENIRMTVDDLQMLNDLQLQKIANLTNRRYEFYQMARAILRPLHEAKVNAARKAGGH